VLALSPPNCHRICQPTPLDSVRHRGGVLVLQVPQHRHLPLTTTIGSNNHLCFILHFSSVCTPTALAIVAITPSSAQRLCSLPTRCRAYTISGPHRPSLIHAQSSRHHWRPFQPHAYPLSHSQSATCTLCIVVCYNSCLLFNCATCYTLSCQRAQLRHSTTLPPCCAMSTPCYLFPMHAHCSFRRTSRSPNLCLVYFYSLLTIHMSETNR
jgi:hypothetical protein